MAQPTPTQPVINTAVTAPPYRGTVADLMHVLGMLRRLEAARLRTGSEGAKALQRAVISAPLCEGHLAKLVARPVVVMEVSVTLHNSQPSVESGWQFVSDGGRVVHWDRLVLCETMGQLVLDLIMNETKLPRRERTDLIARQHVLTGVSFITVELQGFGRQPKGSTPRVLAFTHDQAALECAISAWEKLG